ncbi:MAG: hypothetical protein Q4B01_02090 [Eubacteriales bacterium]|nr:hypothetical protein [Eubacteriales bacterium]
MEYYQGNEKNMNPVYAAAALLGTAAVDVFLFIYQTIFVFHTMNLHYRLITMLAPAAVMFLLAALVYKNRRDYLIVAGFLLLAFFYTLNVGKMMPYNLSEFFANFLYRLIELLRAVFWIMITVYGTVFFLDAGGNAAKRKCYDLWYVPVVVMVVNRVFWLITVIIRVGSVIFGRHVFSSLRILVQMHILPRIIGSVVYLILSVALCWWITHPYTKINADKVKKNF